MQRPASSVGLYGKLPSHGDFIRRRLPADWISAWDPWLQTALSASREKLSERWLEYYLHSPFWRFAIDAGVCGEHPWTGVIMPSVDRVGRYFPLTTAALIPAGVNLFSLIEGAGTWYEEVEKAMVQVLDEQGATLDQLDNGLRRIRPPEALQQPPGNGPRVGTTDSIEVSVQLSSETAEIRSTYPVLLQTLATEHLGAFSVWWTTGAEHVKRCIRVTSGLPDPELFWRFLLSHNHDD